MSLDAKMQTATVSVSTTGIHQRHRKWLILGVVGALWGLITHSTYAGTGDEPHYLAIAHSLAFDHDLDLANNYGQNEPLIADGTLVPSSHVRPDARNVMRPVHDIGLPVVFVPYVRVVRPLTDLVVAGVPSEWLRRAKLTPATLYRHVVSAGMIALTAFLATRIARLCQGVFDYPHRVVCFTLLLTLSPPLLIFSVLFFTEILSAVLCVVAFQVLISTDARRRMDVVIAACATGLLPLVHVRTSAIALVLGILLIVSLLKSKQTALALTSGAVLALFITARASLNYWLWGTWWTTPHARFDEWPGGAEMLDTVSRRAAGLLLDQEYGLIPYFPLSLLTPWGAVALWRVSPKVLAAIVVLIAAYMASLVLPAVNTHGWTGGWSPAGRFLVVVVPLLALPLALGVKQAPKPIVAGLVIVQLGINVYFWREPKNLWNDGDGVAAICERGPLGICRWLPSFVVQSDEVVQR